MAGAFRVAGDLDVAGSTVAIRNASAGGKGGWALAAGPEMLLFVAVAAIL